MMPGITASSRTKNSSGSAITIVGSTFVQWGDTGIGYVADGVWSGNPPVGNISPVGATIAPGIIDVNSPWMITSVVYWPEYNILDISWTSRPQNELPFNSLMIDGVHVYDNVNSDPGGAYLWIPDVALDLFIDGSTHTIQFNQ